MSDRSQRQDRSDNSGSVNRRRFLAGTGVAATAGMSALSGCIGGITGGSGSGNTVTIASFPQDMDGVIFEYLDSEGILEDHLSDTGWDYELQLTFEDIPQFVSGEADIAGISELEAAQIGVEQEISTTVFARRANAYFGWLVKAGGPYDPDQTGGVQATLDKVVQDGANIGIAGWGIGHVPSDQIAFSEGYDLTMSEDGGDFNVVTAEIPAIPQLIDQGELAMGANSPSHGASGRLLDDTLKPLFWDHDKVNELGLGLPPLTGLVSRQSFFDENEDVVQAVFDAANEGQSWFYEQGPDEIPTNENYQELLGAENEEQAQYIVEWQQNADVKHGTEAIPRPKEIGFTQDRISDATDFLGRVEEIGFVPSGWEEYVEMVTL